MKLELTEAWSKKKQHKSNNKNANSLQEVVEEWEWTDCVKFWLAQCSKCCGKKGIPNETHLKVRSKMLNNEISHDIQRFINRIIEIGMI